MAAAQVLLAERDRLEAAIRRQKREIRQIKITLGMDAAALAEVEQKLDAAGIRFERIRPTPAAK